MKKRLPRSASTILLVLAAVVVAFACGGCKTAKEAERTYTEQFLGPIP